MAEADKQDIILLLKSSAYFRDWTSHGGRGVPRELLQFAYDLLYPDLEEETPGTKERAAIRSFLESIRDK